MQMTLKQKLYNYRYQIAVIFIIAVGVFVRVFRFGQVPGGFNQDEAFAAYEAYSLLNFGKDSAGYSFPTYFVSWGSGMNVLESYLAIPFMWLFGCSEAVFRLPQLILSIISMPVLYLLLKRLFDLKTALIGLALLAISPWHIMLSRWGLESNLAPAFLLFGFFFLIKGITQNGYFLLSALFYGISLYSYSITWLVVPLTLVGFGVYLLVSKVKVKISTVILACIILAAFATPHILFLLINQGLINEIKTSFISIPKMVAMRSGEIALSNLFSAEVWKNLLSILLYQNDGLNWNSIKEFGMFYTFNTVFFVLGMAKLINDIVIDIKNKRFSGSVMIIIGFLSSVFVSLIISGANINKTNSLHLFTLIITAVGICFVIYCGKFIKVKLTALICLNLAAFALFCGFYFGEYSNAISPEFRSGVGQAVEFVNDKNCQKVLVDKSIYHSQILFYDKTPQSVFEETVEYENYPSPYLCVKSFGKYTFDLQYDNIGGYDAYIISDGFADWFASNNFDVYSFDCYAVALPKE